MKDILLISFCFSKSTTDMACFSHLVIRKYFAGFEEEDGYFYDEFDCI